jgi:pentatricopeptide repeat protein
MPFIIISVILFIAIVYYLYLVKQENKRLIELRKIERADDLIKLMESEGIVFDDIEIKIGETILKPEKVTITLKK